MVKMNATAELSGRETMTFWPVAMALDVIELATHDESQHKALLDLGVALEYACLHEFTFNSNSISSKAAGALCFLMGRNEGGKTISQQTMFVVLDDFTSTIAKVRSNSNQSDTFGGQRNVTKRVAMVAVSDVNISLMLRYDGLLDSLTDGVEACESRTDLHGNSAAAELHEGLVGVLLRLALHDTGSKALKAHAGAMAALQSLKPGAAAAAAGGGVTPTKEARRFATSALFQLEGRGAVTSEQSNVESSGVSAKMNKHVMISYCWDQQAVIKQVHAALKAHGYRCWIDFEQMTGSTVDSMALAVENAEVMLIGVSRQYKESTNCRLEAQYAMQREVPTVPLMLADGYRADGWLGMLIGTRMWYGFFGSVLLDESLFGGRVSELCRDIGDRGRGAVVSAISHGVVSDGGGGGVVADVNDEPANALLRLELHGLTSLRALTAKAEAAGVDEIELDVAASRDEIVALILGAAMAAGR